MTTLETDVCVAGAGFAGLTAALRLRQAGRAVVVLEAAARIGGRTWTDRLVDGTLVERGGAWLGPGQDRAYALAAEMGVATYPTWGRGEHVLVQGGVARRYRGALPPGVGAVQLASLGLAMARLDRLARQVPLEAPWDAPRAERWDARTVRAWIDRNTLPGVGRRLLTQVLHDIFTSDLSEVSLLHALYLIHSHQNLNHLTTIEGGAQQDRLVGGTGAVLAGICARLGDAVRLEAPVVRITHGRDGATVASPALVVRARRVIVAVPAATAARIVYDPPLPIDRAQLLQRMPLGSIWKIALVYDEPWWRDEGFSGQSLDPDSPLPLTLDACGASTPPGILNLFCSGAAARRLSGLAADERSRAAVEALSLRFGPKAARVRDYAEQDWTAEPWIGGGMLSRFGPGVLTTFGRSLRPAVGCLHWAGTETATVTHGGIDGAIRSGERAAAEIVAALGS
ncbi:MAG TPA: FAD-dependent oxidoreductase [Candidatus Binatia bacterium]